MPQSLAALMLLFLLGLPFLAWTGLPAVPDILPPRFYPAFHGAVEIFTVAVAILVFATGFHLLEKTRPTAMFLLASAFFGVALLDFLHLMSYSGMPDFFTANTPHKAIILWLAARLLAAGALLAWALLPVTPSPEAPPRFLLLSASLAYVFFCGYVGVFRPEWVPATFVPGQGLTPFKIGMEWLVILLHAATLAVLAGRSQCFRSWISFFVPALLLLIASELFFTLYAQVTDTLNLLGHIYKLFAYLLIYRAIFVEGVHQPYTCLEEASRLVEYGRQEWRETFDSIPDLMFIHDPACCIIRCNRAYAQAAGLPFEQIIGQPYYRIFPKSDGPRSAYLEMFRLGEALYEEDFYLAEQERHYNVRYSQVTDLDGEYLHSLQVMRDITGRKLLEDQLLQARKMEAIGVLAGGIAHDFNNILTPIMMHTQMVLADTPAGTAAHHSLEQVHKAAERARDLVRQIREFSRQGEYEPQSLELGAVIKEGLKFMRSTIPLNIELESKILTDHDLVLADPTQMLQMIMNLTLNAAQAMHEKGGRIVISLSEQEEEGGKKYLKMVVSDTGVGIPPEILPRIFEPYLTTKGRGEGTGLGLAVVHGLVEKHGGVITVRSEPGMGTDFEVLLPMVAGEVPALSGFSQPLPGGRERILLVDNDPAVVEAAASALIRLGYRLTTKTDSLAALAVFRFDPSRFDLVITDQAMPGMSGSTMAKEMLRLRPNLPVILCSGFSGTINEEMVRTLGIVALVAKPFGVEDIAPVIRKALGKEQERGEG